MASSWSHWRRSGESLLASTLTSLVKGSASSELVSDSSELFGSDSVGSDSPDSARSSDPDPDPTASSDPLDDSDPVTIPGFRMLVDEFVVVVLTLPDPFELRDDAFGRVPEDCKRRVS